MSIKKEELMDEEYQGVNGAVVKLMSRLVDDLKEEGINVDVFYTSKPHGWRLRCRKGHRSFSDLVTFEQLERAVSPEVILNHAFKSIKFELLDNYEPESEEIEQLEEENERLKKKLKSIANAAAECLEEREMYWGSVERIEKNNHEYKRLRLAVAEAREEENENVNLNLNY